MALTLCRRIGEAVCLHACSKQEWSDLVAAGEKAGTYDAMPQDMQDLLAEVEARPTRAEVWTVMDEAGALFRQMFHLPGEHDQRTHGRRKITPNDDLHEAPTGELADHMAKWHRDLTDLTSLMAAIDSGYGGEDLDKLCGGHQMVHRVRYKNGTVGVMKTATDAGAVREIDAEQLTGLTGRLLGIPVPRVARVLDDTIVMDHVAGMSGFQEAMADPVGFRDWVTQTWPTKDVQKLGFLDLLTDNLDRHDGNWIKTPEGRVVGIDHGHTFMDLQGMTPGLPDEARMTDYFTDAWLEELGGRTEWAQNPLTEEDVTWIRSRIMDLEDDFATLDHHDWWEFMLGRFEAMARNRYGLPGENLFAPSGPGLSASGTTRTTDPIATSPLATFHLPGEHDQETHGRRGLSLPEEGGEWTPTAVWSGHAEHWHMDLTAQQPLLDALSSGGMSSEDLTPGGQADSVWVMRTASGMDVVVKEGGPKRMYDAEQVTSAVGRAIGAPVPVVLRAQGDQIAMEHVPGHTLADLMYQQEDPSGWLDAEFHDTARTRAGRLLGLLDALVSNPDRENPANTIVGPDGRWTGIDHGSAFSLAVPQKGVIATPLGVAYMGESNPLTKADVEKLDGILKGLRPEFEVVERTDWYRQMMDRWEIIRANASGTENLVASGAVFHLPGQHDQRTHGKRGLLPPGEIAKPGQPQGTLADHVALWNRDLSELGGLVASVQSGEVSGQALSGGQMGDTRRVGMADGRVLVKKKMKKADKIVGPILGDPARQADAEQLAGLLGSHIGAPVPHVLRTDPDEVVMDLVPGETWAQLRVKHKWDAKTDAVKLADAAETPDGLRLGLFDLLTDNWDRGNPTNIVMAADGSPRGIDHAMTWGMGELGENDPSDAPLVDYTSPFSLSYLDYVPPPPGAAALDHRMKWDKNPLHPDDVGWLRDRLDDLRDDFEVLGRLEWWEFASRRLDAIGAGASGTRRLFGV